MRFASTLCLCLLICIGPVLHGAEDPKTEVIGKWISIDEGKQPLVFEKDGAFRRGFIKEKGEWLWATGKYSISAEGKIDTVAEHGGVTLFTRYTLTGGVIHGSRGPSPHVTWTKLKE